MQQKGSTHLILIFIVLVIIVIYSGAKIVTAPKDASKLPPMTTDPTRPETNVKDKTENLPDGGTRYINSDESFQIDVPKDWFVKINQGPNENFGASIYWTANGKENVEYDGMMPSTDIISTRMNKYREPQQMKTSTKLKINGLDAEFMIHDNKGEQTEAYVTYNYQIQKSPREYFWFEFGSDTEVPLKNKKAEIAAIMNTFKLVPNPKDGQQIIFKNPQLKYSFKYPSNWLVNTFQNSGNYNQGITVINEEDQEILTLEARQLGERCRTILGGFDEFYCKQPYAVTKDGYEFKLSVNPENPKTSELLNSFEGLTFVNIN